MDSSCPVPCGEADTCEEDRCALFRECFNYCKTCHDFGYDDPCLILLDDRLGKDKMLMGCVLDMNGDVASW